jgi:hypothetical protein
MRTRAPNNSGQSGINLTLALDVGEVEVLTCARRRVHEDEWEQVILYVAPVAQFPISNEAHVHVAERSLHRIPWRSEER